MAWKNLIRAGFRQCRGISHDRGTGYFYKIFQVLNCAAASSAAKYILIKQAWIWYSYMT